jgi:putative transposase
MKNDYPYISKEILCRLFGKTRHALYDHLWRKEEDNFKEEIILQLVHRIREKLPRLGTRKLLFLLDAELKSHQIDIGRDALFELLAAHKLLIRQRKRKVITTDSRHWMRKYANLIQQLVINRPEQVWVSDITYIRMKNQWGYLSMITDAFSRKIMGICFRSDLLAQGCVDALHMALSNRQYRDEKLIHHSDRGSQYCCKDYIELLNSENIYVSMTENGDPYENALAERMNGIIKNEFNLYSSALSFEDTYSLIVHSVDAYNRLRPHGSCDYLTPIKAHNETRILKKRWKKYDSKKCNKPTFDEQGPGGGSLKSKPPGPSYKNEHNDKRNTDLSSPYSAQQNLR